MPDLPCDPDGPACMDAPLCDCHTVHHHDAPAPDESPCDTMEAEE